MHHQPFRDSPYMKCLRPFACVILANAASLRGGLYLQNSTLPASVKTSCRENPRQSRLPRASRFDDWSMHHERYGRQLSCHRNSSHENQIEQAQVHKRTHSPVKASPAQWPPNPSKNSSEQRVWGTHQQLQPQRPISEFRHKLSMSAIEMLQQLAAGHGTVRLLKSDDLRAPERGNTFELQPKLSEARRSPSSPIHPWRAGNRAPYHRCWCTCLRSSPQE
jgi:hypothetical protein